MAKDKVTEPFDIVDTVTGEVIKFPVKRERKKAKDGTERGAPYIYVTPEQWKTIEVMAGLGAIDEEIADAVQISTRTLTDDYHGQFFQAIKKRGMANSKISLRRAQFESAIKKGNVTMQIFLGKQILGQKDQVETTANDSQININVSAATPNDIELD